MQAADLAGSTNAWDVIIRFLDWPFLLFLTVTSITYFFRRELRGLFSRGDIKISWGENRSIHLRELSEKLDQEFDPLREDLDVLRQEVSALKAMHPVTGAKVQGVSIYATALGGPEADLAAQRMRQAMLSGEYEWRSIERLAALAGITQDQARAILRKDAQVHFSVGKSGKQLAKLELSSSSSGTA